MTLQKVITRVDELRPNQYTNAQKADWLTDLDRMVYEEIVCTHELPEGMREMFEGYDEEHMTEQLLVPDVWAGVYEWWLYAQMDLANQELEKYANDMQMFNAMYNTLEKGWNRKYMPVQRVKAIDYGHMGGSRTGYVPDPLEA